MHPKQRACGDEDDPTMYVQDAYAALDSLLALLNETRMLDASSPQDVEALAAIVREGSQPRPIRADSPDGAAAFASPSAIARRISPVA